MKPAEFNKAIEEESLLKDVKSGYHIRHVHIKTLKPTGHIHVVDVRGLLYETHISKLKKR